MKIHIDNLIIKIVWATPIVLGLALVASEVATIGNFIEDDSLISLRYSERLLEGQGLTWTAGERVEGYSNLSWVLLVAALGLFGVNLVVAVRIVAVVSIISTFVAVVLAARRFSAGWTGATIASVLLGATASVPVWTVGGLEQPLVIACLAIALWCLAEFAHATHVQRRWVYGASVSLAVLVLTRPDAPLFVAVIAAGTTLIMWRRAGLSQIAQTLGILISIPLLAWALQLAFRLGYYGQWVPNTALVKAKFTPARAREGLDYVWLGLKTNAVHSIGATLGFSMALVGRSTRRWALTLAALSFAWVGYVVAIGGDHFPAWRHLLPFHVFGALLAALGVAGVRERWPLAWPVGSVLLVASLVTLPFSLKRQWALRENHVTRFARWQWEGQSIGKLFGDAFVKEQPLYAVTAAGCLPYFSKLPALDMLGLNDRHIAMQPPNPNMPLAHDHGDGPYVLRRAPDLITFGMPRGQYPTFKSGEEMANDPIFLRDYTRRPFQALAPLAMSSESYIRWVGRVGIRTESDGALVLPTYLFDGVKGWPHPAGGMGALVREGVPAKLPLKKLPAGRWHVRLDPETPHVTLSLTPFSPKYARNLEFREHGVVIASEEAALNVMLSTTGVSTIVGTVRIEPIDADTAVGPRPTVSSSAKSERRFSMQAGLKDWIVTGTAFGTGDDKSAYAGQTQLLDVKGTIVNSYRPGLGDTATGMMKSPTFVAGQSSTLHFSVGGGRAEGFDTQVGIRLVETLGRGEQRVRFVASGERDERLRPINLDLGWLAGRTLHIEVFDESVVGWGHILVSDFVLKI